MADEHQNLAAIRERLAGHKGKLYWRSLEELAQSKEFEELLHREFPKGAAEWQETFSRRTFLKISAAALSLAGLTGCGQAPREKILPYVQQPEILVPGKPLFYASAVLVSGYAKGVLVEQHMGRPTKIEGNPQHPASLGASDVYMQAALLSLYDPERSQAVTRLTRISTWDNFVDDIGQRMAAVDNDQGAGLRLLTGTITSPALLAQIRTLLGQYPQARWYQYDPIGRDNMRAGLRAFFGQDLNAVQRFDQARVILSLDGDWLLFDPGNVRYGHDFINGRRVSQGAREMNRLYAVESTPKLVGAVADHRLPLRASQVESFARAVAQRLGVDAGGDAALPAGVDQTWVDAMVRDLQAAGSASLVIAGDHQPPAVHALAAAMNDALGSIGTTVNYIPAVEGTPEEAPEGGGMAALDTLVNEMNAGQISTLVIMGSNPVYTAPAHLKFAEALQKVELRVHTGLYEDETSQYCHWHIPMTHELEMWGDARAFDGTITLIQPLIAPLYESHSPYELLDVLLGGTGSTSYDLVRGYWQQQRGQGTQGTQGTQEGGQANQGNQGGQGGQGSQSNQGTQETSTGGQGGVGEDGNQDQNQNAFERFWRTAVHTGFIPDSASEPLSLTPGRVPAPVTSAAQEGLEIIFHADPSVRDGEYANNAWLQELPKPLSTLTWDNVAMISPATASEQNVETGDLVTLQVADASVQAPIWVQPGHPDGAITVTLGYGRERAGQVGSGVGFNAYILRTTSSPWFGGGLRLVKTGERYPLANTQEHFAMEDRGLVRSATLEEFIQHPDFVHEHEHISEPHASLYPEYNYKDEPYAWGMAIDLNACIGCNACVLGCVSENNIPSVGKEQVLNSREMHWLKVDTYFSGEPENPETYFQPRPCMHCEKAPCEVVCPVAATVHDAEGINNMIYNRCVGTRYCSNNCPYKVRRFNYLQYTDQTTPVIQLRYNPDVTVRERGVMEKCTYCIQRINNARQEAEVEGRQVRDGEILTACQQACPTQAIIFGNINDPNSLVRQLKDQPLNYGLLTELGTQPRTTYLARVRNPNPELVKE